MATDERDPMDGIVQGPPVPLRRPGRWIAVVLAVLVLAWFARTIFTNPNFQWPVVWKYLFDPNILRGVVMTVELTLTAMCIGISLGILFALLRLSENGLLSFV